MDKMYEFTNMDKKNIGNPSKAPGIPYQDTNAFTNWLNSTIGKPEEIKKVILIGLTIDCCVLCTAQELRFRGYKVYVLKEGVDTYWGSGKEEIINNYPLKNWAKPISWEELKEVI